MLSYYKITHLKSNMTAYRQTLPQKFIEKYPELQNISEQKISDQQRTIGKNNFFQWTY